MTDTRFKSGQSGNRNGRPAGKTPGAKIRKAIEKHAPDILQAVIDAAVSGDMMACKMLLDRITPPLKAQALAITLPFSESLAEQGNEVIRAIVTGKVSPDIGSQLITALANQSKVIEIDELTKRIELLEQSK